MPAIARGQPSDGNNPVLELFTSAIGVLARATANLTDLWSAGDKLGPGHVVARWTPRTDEPLGLHELRWFVQMAPGQPSRSACEPHDPSNRLCPAAGRRC